MNEWLHRFGRLRHDYGRSQSWLPAKQAGRTPKVSQVLTETLQTSTSTGYHVEIAWQAWLPCAAFSLLWWLCWPHSVPWTAPASGPAVLAAGGLIVAYANFKSAMPLPVWRHPASHKYGPELCIRLFVGGLGTGRKLGWCYPQPRDKLSHLYCAVCMSYLAGRATLVPQV